MFIAAKKFATTVFLQWHESFQTCDRITSFHVKKSWKISIALSCTLVELFIHSRLMVNTPLTYIKYILLSHITAPKILYIMYILIKYNDMNNCHLHLFLHRKQKQHCENILKNIAKFMRGNPVIVRKLHLFLYSVVLFMFLERRWRKYEQRISRLVRRCSRRWVWVYTRYSWFMVNVTWKHLFTAIAKSLYVWETAYRFSVCESVDFYGCISNIHTKYMMTSFAWKVWWDEESLSTKRDFVDFWLKGLCSWDLGCCVLMLDFTLKIRKD